MPVNNPECNPASTPLKELAAAVQNAIGLLPHDTVETAQRHISHAAEGMSRVFSEGDAGRGIYDTLIVAAEHAKHTGEALQVAGTGLGTYLSEIGFATGPRLGHDTVMDAAVNTGGHSHPSERALPEWHAARDMQLLASLPKLPTAITRTEDGELLVTERPPEMLVPNKLRHLHTPQPLTAERRAELELIADRMGVRLDQLADAEIAAAALHDDPAVDPSTKRMWRDDVPLPLMHVLRTAQEQALGQTYAEKVTARGRELLQQYAPDALPQEPTAVVGMKGNAAGGYSGRFGQMHVLSIAPPSHITHDQVEAIEDLDDRATVGAHELAHQKFIEVSGADSTMIAEGVADTSYNQTPATDAQDALQRAYDYVAQFDTASTEQEKLASRVISAASEVYAYVIEHEVRVGMGIEPIVKDTGYSNLDWGTHDYRTAIEYALGPDAPLPRGHIKETLLHLDWKHIANMPPDALQAVLDDPKKIFTLPQQADAV